MLISFMFIKKSALQLSSGVTHISTIQGSVHIYLRFQSTYRKNCYLPKCVPDATDKSRRHLLSQISTNIFFKQLYKSNGYYNDKKQYSQILNTCEGATRSFQKNSPRLGLQRQKILISSLCASKTCFLNAFFWIIRTHLFGDLIE